MGIISDDVAHESFWWRQARPGPADDAAALPGRCDVLAIGGGASSRAAGFSSGRAGVSKPIDLTAAVGAKRARDILEEADEALEHLEQLIVARYIDCDYVRRGRFVGAHTPTAYNKLAVKMAEYNEKGISACNRLQIRSQCRLLPA